MTSSFISSRTLFLPFCFFSFWRCWLAICKFLWKVEIFSSSCTSSVYCSSVPDLKVTLRLSTLQQCVSFRLPFQRLEISCTELFNKPIQPLSTCSSFKSYKLAWCTESWAENARNYFPVSCLWWASFNNLPCQRNIICYFWPPKTLSHGVLSFTVALYNKVDVDEG